MAAIKIAGRVCLFVASSNIFDEPVCRILGMLPLPKGQVQLPTYLDHQGRWRELGTIGAGTMIDWPTESAARTFAQQHADGIETANRERSGA